MSACQTLPRPSQEKTARSDAVAGCPALPSHPGTEPKLPGGNVLVGNAASACSPLPSSAGRRASLRDERGTRCRTELCGAVHAHRRVCE